LENGELRVWIKDNGAGFDPAKMEDSFGHGLNNMKRRLADIGGNCTIESQAGQGSLVQMRLAV